MFEIDYRTVRNKTQLGATGCDTIFIISSRWKRSQDFRQRLCRLMPERDQ